jgi:hypothetical protein
MTKQPQNRMHTKSCTPSLEPWKYSTWNIPCSMLRYQPASVLYDPCIFLSSQMLPSSPHSIPWCQMLQPQPWRVDRTGARVNENVVQGSAAETSQEWRHHRYLIATVSDLRSEQRNSLPRNSIRLQTTPPHHIPRNMTSTSDQNHEQC